MVTEVLIGKRAIIAALLVQGDSKYEPLCQCLNQKLTGETC